MTPEAVVHGLDVGAIVKALAEIAERYPAGLGEYDVLYLGSVSGTRTDGDFHVASQAETPGTGDKSGSENAR